jgi:hypothetical protein
VKETFPLSIVAISIVADRTIPVSSLYLRDVLLELFVLVVNILKYCTINIQRQSNDKLIKRIP